MSYRPITDIWIMARPKLTGGVKYYGAYPAGFLERARALLGVGILDPVLHVCGGHARLYPYDGGFGPNDRTLDLAPECNPDYLQDCTERLPFRTIREGFLEQAYWDAIIADPPYSPVDAQHYAPQTYPRPRLVLQRMLEVVRVGGKVGILHYCVPRPPKDIPVKFNACIGVWCGYDNNMRVFSVFTRLPVGEQCTRNLQSETTQQVDTSA